MRRPAGSHRVHEGSQSAADQRRRPHRGASRTTALTAGLVAAVLLAGCSGQGSSDDAGAAQSTRGSAGGGGADGRLGVASDAAAPAPAAPGQAGEKASESQVVSGRVTPGRALIRTGELSVRVKDVRTAAERAGDLARAAGGDVESEERSSSDGGGGAVVVLRVPPKAFDQTLSRLADLGKERDRRLGTTDVTEQVVDLDARIATQRASVARVRALLDRASGLGEVVQIEGELTKRTADLESLEARLASLEEQVDLSTITLRLDSREAPALAPAGPRGFDDGLAAGWSALVTLGRALGVTLGALLPFAPFLLVGGALVWRARTRRPSPQGTAAL